jgi:hypothetical protein
MKIINTVLVFTLAGWSAMAQSPFVHEGSIGEVEKKANPSDRPETLELGQWVGQKFIFLPMPPSQRAYGYQLFEHSLPYESWVGKIVTVTDVRGLAEVTFATDADRTIRATAYSGTVTGVAPLLDLEYARSRWLGKTLWLRRTALFVWSEESEKLGSINLPKYSPLTVEDVVAGWYEHRPVRFILKTREGRIGFQDLSMSGTNVRIGLRKVGDFGDRFLESDPRETYQWSKQVWSAIENEKVFVGMTVEQARMSWGEPKAINRTTTARGSEEQWVYGDSNYLYVSDGKLTAVQN